MLAAESPLVNQTDVIGIQASSYDVCASVFGTRVIDLVPVSELKFVY